jgi:hypothetical protein
MKNSKSDVENMQGAQYHNIEHCHHEEDSDSALSETNAIRTQRSGGVSFGHI